MSFELFQTYVYLVIDLFAVLAAVFGCIVVYMLWKKEYEPQIKKIVITLFALLTIGSIFYAAAEILWDILFEISGEFPIGGVPDLLWPIGYFFMLAGLACFAVYIYRQHGQLKKGVAVMAATGIISALIVYYLISRYIIGFQQEETTIEMILDYFYPIMSAMILTASVNVYLFFRKLENFGIPLLYIAIANLLNFVGDMLYTYYSWNDIYGLAGVISDSSYALAYLLIAYAFYILLGRIKLARSAA